MLPDSLVRDHDDVAIMKKKRAARKKKLPWRPLRRRMTTNMIGVLICLTSFSIIYFIYYVILILMY
jgi:hypothetical protein